MEHNNKKRATKKELEKRVSLPEIRAYRIANRGKSLKRCVGLLSKVVIDSLNGISKWKGS